MLVEDFSSSHALSYTYIFHTHFYNNLWDEYYPYFLIRASRSRIVTISRLERWVRDRRNYLTRYCFPQKSFTASSFPWEIQTNDKSWLFLIINQMHSTIITETFLLQHSLKMNLFFLLSLSPQPSFLQIIVYLYKPNFCPFKIFISLADDGPPLHTCIWPSWILQCQPTALFLDPLKLPFTCQVSYLKICLTSQRIRYEFFARNNGQSSSTIMKWSTSFHCGCRARLTRWP